MLQCGFLLLFQGALAKRGVVGEGGEGFIWLVGWDRRSSAGNPPSRGLDHKYTQVTPYLHLPICIQQTGLVFLGS